MTNSVTKLQNLEGMIAFLVLYNLMQFSSEKENNLK